MYPNSMPVGSILAVLILCSMAIGILIAMKRGFFPALVRLGMIIVCLLVSIPLTAAIANRFPAISETVMRKLLGDVIAQIEQSSPSTMDLLCRMPIAVIAPILFIMIFYALKSLSLIVFRLLKPLLPSHSTLIFRILGGLAGALSSLICAWAIMLPLLGMVGLAHRTIETLSEADTSANQQLDRTMAQVENLDHNILGPAVDNFVSDLFTEDGDSALYRSMTKFKLHEETLVLSTEVDRLSQTAVDALSFFGSLPKNFKLADLSKTHLEQLRTLTQDVDDSELLKNICAEWIVALTDAWRQDKTLLNIADPAENRPIEPLADTFYGFLATTDSKMLAKDLNLFIDILDILVRHDIFAGKNNLQEKLADDALVEALSAPLNEHERIRVTICELIVPLTREWSLGQSYSGIAEPALDEHIKPVGRMLYRYLATTNESVLTEDIRTVSGLLSLVDQNSTSSSILFDDIFLAQLNSFLGDHTRFRSHFSTWLAALTGAWAKGNAYEGLTVPHINELLDPIIKTLFDVMATTNDKLIHDDLTALTELVRVLRNYEAFNTEKSGKQMADTLMNSHFVSDINAVIYRHERFEPLRDIVAGLGLTAISSQLPTELPNSQLMKDLSGKISVKMNSIADQSQDARTESVKDEVDKILSENNVNVPDSVPDIISQIVIKEFGDMKNVTEKDVTDYLLDLYNSTGKLDSFFK